MTDDHVTDYSKITDQIYIGSDLCKGIDCPVHSVEFKKLGIMAEVNLELERVESPTPGVEVYVWLPVMDKTAPKLGQLLVGSAAINEMVKSGNNVYVHCREGHSRGPTMVAAYFIRYEKMSVEEAIEFIAKNRPEIHLEEVQKMALEEFWQLWK